MELSASLQPYLHNPMPQRSRLSFLDQIKDWLDSILNPKKPAAEPQEIVKRRIEVRVENPGDRRNLVEEIENPDRWSLIVLRVRPIQHKHRRNKSGTNAAPSTSAIGEVSHYIFIHKIPPSRRGKAIAVLAAGKRHLITDTSLEFGYHQVSVLRIPDRHNKDTWFYPYKKGFRFSGEDGGDRAALRFAEILAKRLVVSDLAAFKFGQQIERIVEAGSLGTWKEREEARRSLDPFGQG